MIETLKIYFKDFINGQRNEKVDVYVMYEIRVFDQNLATKTLYKEYIDDELYELLEVAKLLI